MGKNRIIYDVTFQTIDIKTNEEKIKFRGKEYDIPDIFAFALYFEYRMYLQEEKNLKEIFICDEKDKIPLFPVYFKADKDTGIEVLMGDITNTALSIIGVVPTEDSSIWFSPEPIMLSFEEGIQILKDNYLLFEKCGIIAGGVYSYSLKPVN